ncbi:LysO family transporter, partial [Escherichia coli]|uniref:LysO family transporter n=1 Tax=Escherichia coli TaxID=562 RepID=UPI002119A9D1
ILLTESFGTVIASAALFNHMARHLISIIVITGLIRRSRSTSLGLCGATSMYLTLQVHKPTGVLDMLPAAIINSYKLKKLIKK